MEFLVLAGVVGAAILNGYNPGMKGKIKTAHYENANNTFRVFIPDDFHPRHGFETPSHSDAVSIASRFHSAVVRSHEGREVFGIPSDNELRSRSIRFQQKPFLKK